MPLCHYAMHHGVTALCCAMDRGNGRYRSAKKELLSWREGESLDVKDQGSQEVQEFLQQVLVVLKASRAPIARPGVCMLGGCRGYVGGHVGGHMGGCRTWVPWVRGCVQASCAGGVCVCVVCVCARARVRACVRVLADMAQPATCMMDACAPLLPRPTAAAGQQHARL